MAHFNNLLSTPPIPDSTASTAPSPNIPASLTFAGLLLIPSLSYPTGPLETLPPELWASTFASKLTVPIATVHAFLPTIAAFKSRVIVLTPTIASSLVLPFNGLETTLVRAMDGFVQSLRTEMDMVAKVAVVQLKLGNVDVQGRDAGAQAQTSAANTNISLTAAAGEGQVMAWQPATREAYARTYMQQQQQQKSGDKVVRGSNVRELHNAVFDALTQQRPWAVWRVGRGSLVYEVLGRWVPSPLIRWMMGMRRVGHEA